MNIATHGTSIKQLLTTLKNPTGLDELSFPQFPDASPDPILITNAKGRIYYVNPAWEKLTRYTLAEVKNKNPRFLNSDKTPKRIYKKLWQVLSEGKSFSTDDVIDRKKDGTEYQVHSTFFPIRKKNKNIFYAQIQYDITEHRQLEKVLHEREEILQLIINNANGYAIYLLDKKGFIKSWNPGAERLKGYSSEEVLGKHFSLFYPLEKVTRKMTQKVLTIASKKGRYEEEGLRVKKDGTFFWAHVVLNAIRSKRGALIGFVNITRDITQERELKQQKDAFIGIASHELKTPITTLSAYTQLLQKKLEKSGDEKEKYFLTHIRVQAERLNQLIEDLLNVSRIDSGKMVLYLKETDLLEVIRKVVTDFQYTAESHIIEVVGTIQSKIIADSHRIEQVLINLLSNAIKYSPNATKVIVHLTDDGNHITVGIEDSGLGIAREDLPHLFKRFYRTKDKDEGSIIGFGLGLFIAHEIVKKHNGKMWVESKKGKGSTFYFSLPVTDTLYG